MQKQTVRWQVFGTAANLQEAACAAILSSAREAIAQRGKFLIVLAGGTTPRAIYQQLRHCETDWSKWHIYYGDERCLPPQHADRNSLMAEDAWLAHVAIPAAQVHPIPAELGPVDGAARYCEALSGVDAFDMVLLGLGEDGHTASLFPGQPWEVDGAAAIPVFGAPKPPPERISLSATRLSDARSVVFLVTGAGKQEAVRAWRSSGNLPAAAIAPQSGVDVWLDQAASGESGSSSH